MEIIDKPIDELDSLKRTLGDLVRIRTVNPPGEEWRVAEYVEKRLAPKGFEIENFEAEPGRTNLLARIGARKPRVLIACHSDTVPPGDGWSHDPFEVWERDGKLFGRGVCDNKGQIAAALTALEFMAENNIEPVGALVLGVFADEERGSGLGIKAMAERGLLDQIDLAVVPDTGGNMELMVVAEKGYLDLKITAHGIQAHGSRPELGLNAIVLNSLLINRLKDYVLAHASHPFLSAPTINFGLIRGGEASNMVPARCEMTLNIRFLPGQTPESIRDEIHDLVRDLGEFEFEIIQVQPPIEVDPSRPLINSLSILAQETTGREVQFTGIGGATVSKFLVARGIPSVGFGPGDLGAAHTADEWITIRDLEDFTRFIIALGQKGI